MSGTVTTANFAFLALAGLAALSLPAAGARGRPSGPELLSVRKIWDRAPHNAFTDLVRFHDRWYCTFREGAAHVSPDGALRVLTSTDGVRWETAASLTSTTADLRDPKITVTPDGRLMLTSAAALHPPAPARHQTMAWFSADGRAWSEPVPVGEPDLWLWRVAWHKATAYGVGYHTAGGHFVRLYRSEDGRRFSPLVETLHDQGEPSEAALLFGMDALCLLRRDGAPGTALLGTAAAPYRAWRWRDLGRKMGGPAMLRLPDGRIVAGGRLYDGRIRTALCWLDPAAATLTPFLDLPSGGDTSYPGLAWHDRLLWASYYSSHEGKTSIYLAKVRLP